MSMVTLGKRLQTSEAEYGTGEKRNSVHKISLEKEIRKYQEGNRSNAKLSEGYSN